jgi:hypothetical protein
MWREDSIYNRRSSQAVQSGEVLLGKFVIEDATEEVNQEEKTAQPIFLLASSNLGDEILVRGVDLACRDRENCLFPNASVLIPVPGKAGVHHTNMI